MKKVFAFFLSLCIIAQSFAAVPVAAPAPKATEIFFPVGKSGQMVSLMELTHMKTKEFEALSGQPLKLADKVTFKLAQRELKKSVAADGTITSKKLNKFFKRAGETGFHFGGFALGFFVGLIGVLIAYLIKDDYKRNRVKWAWIGLGAFLIVYLALVAALV